MGKNQHVVLHRDGWAVKGTGNQKVTRVVGTQGEAINIAQDIVRNQHSDVEIHGEDGRIRVGNSCGNDPCSLKDKK